MHRYNYEIVQAKLGYETPVMYEAWIASLAPDKRPRKPLYDFTQKKQKWTKMGFIRHTIIGKLVYIAKPQKKRQTSYGFQPKYACRLHVSTEQRLFLESCSPAELSLLHPCNVKTRINYFLTNKSFQHVNQKFTQKCQRNSWEDNSQLSRLPVKSHGQQARRNTQTDNQTQPDANRS